MNEKTTRIIRWTARIWASLMAAMIAVIFVGHAVEDGIGPFLNMTIRDSLMMVVFAATWFGLVLGWKWERLGGFLIVGGMAVFYLFDYLLSGSFPQGAFFSVIAFPGVLFLLASLTKSTDPTE